MPEKSCRTFRLLGDKFPISLFAHLVRWALLVRTHNLLCHSFFLGSTHLIRAGTPRRPHLFDRLDAMERSITYYVHEGWRHGEFTVALHRGDCIYCNDGKGQAVGSSLSGPTPSTCMANFTRSAGVPIHPPWESIRVTFMP
jgi:hypothetical protein